MNFSNIANRDSGRASFDELSSNYGLDSPSCRASVWEKAGMGSSPGLSKPRLLKTRKQMGSRHPRSMPGHESSRGLPSFNPFRSDFNAVSSGVGKGGLVPGGVGKSGDDTFVFGAYRSDSRLNVDSDKGKEFLDGLRESKISSGNPLNAEGGATNFDRGAVGSLNPLGGSDMVSNLSDDIGKLNIKGSGNCGRSGDATDEEFKFSVNNKTKLWSGSCENDNSFNKHGGDNVTCNAHNNGGFVFGILQKGNDSFAESLAATLHDQIRNLNIKGSVSTSDSNDSIGDFSGKTEDVLSIEMDKLRIRSKIGNSAGQSDTGTSSTQVFVKEFEPVNLGKKNNISKQIPPEFTLNETMPFKDGIGIQVPAGKPNNVTQLSETSKYSDCHVHPDANVSGVTSSDRPDHKYEFSFMSKQDEKTPNIEFRTNLKTSRFNHSVGFSAKRQTSKDSRSKQKWGKLRQVNPVHLQPERSFIPKESTSEPNLEYSESYSPMEVSPYQETLADKRSPTEASVTSDESIPFDKDESSTDPLRVSGEAIDEDLVAATKRLDIDDKSEVKCSETEGESCEYRSGKSIGTKDIILEESLAEAASESFMSANEQFDTNSDASSAPAEMCSGSDSKIEMRDSDGSSQFSFASCSEEFGSSNFTFAACSSGQGQSSVATHQYKKKSRAKFGYGSYSSNTDTADSCASSSVHFFPLSEISSLLSPCKGLKTELSTYQGRGENRTSLNDNQVIGHDSVSASAVAQEACEKWRLRGNQAYANGDLSKAEDWYTQGVDCIPQNETTKSCLKALMLCYSNRAATRMSLGRVREALEDCMAAAAIDPHFLRVQVRAANCFLALGEVEDAARCFKKCLQSRSDISADRKVAVEASEGLLKAQKVSDYVTRAAELLQHRTSSDAESALGIISDALSVCLYSEKLVEMKAEALLMLHRYEEVIQLCKQTVSSAEKNSPLRGADGKSASKGGTSFQKHSSFRLWRVCLSFKSYFYLGRLEEALEIVEKEEGSGIESEALESVVPLVVTVRELLKHKASGNEAFQSGRHAEAIEHYTAALTCNVESRPFAAVCFCNRAAAYKVLGQITDAIADCSLAIALDGNYLKAISRRATLFEMIRDYEQAATDLRKLLSLLSKRVDEKASHSGASGRLATGVDDLKEVQLRLSTIEEESRKEIPLDMYLILGVEPFATATDIRKAYRKAALRHHPDKAGQYLARGENGDDRVWKEIAQEAHKDADKLFKMIGEAYAVLSDPTKRSQYDMEIMTLNAQNIGNRSDRSRMRTDVPNYPYNQSSNRQPDTRRSYWSSHAQGSEAYRSNRYY